MTRTNADPWREDFVRGFLLGWVRGSLIGNGLCFVGAIIIQNTALLVVTGLTFLFALACLAVTRK